MKQTLGLKILKILICNSDCRVVKFLQDRRIEAEFKKVRVGESFSTHLLKLLKPMEGKENIDIKGSYMILPGNYIWIETESCTSCKIFSKLPVIVESISYVESSGVVVRLIVPGRLFHRHLIENLKKAGLDVKTIFMKDYVDYELTKRQKEVLALALKLNYLGSRRSMKLKDIAFLIGLDTSTISRIIRDAVKKIVKKHLEE
ncbi:MAG: helix-turn-helix domain-containing protein [Nitrososphaerota archaeon]|nr:helix-turn-helix domain-containing protein [Candidatus Geocrenenecus dongiae]